MYNNINYKYTKNLCIYKKLAVYNNATGQTATLKSLKVSVRQVS